MNYYCILYIVYCISTLFFSVPFLNIYHLKPVCDEFFFYRIYKYIFSLIHVLIYIIKQLKNKQAMFNTWWNRRFCRCVQKTGNTCTIWSLDTGTMILTSLNFKQTFFLKFSGQRCHHYGAITWSPWQPWNCSDIYGNRWEWR